MLVTCMPRASRSATGITTTDHASARSTTSSYTRSRAPAVSSLESARPGTLPRRPAGSTHAAATSGPAQAPRPASSAPATTANPRRRSERSMSHRTSDRSSAEVPARFRGPGGAGVVRTAIAVRQYDALRRVEERAAPGNARGRPPGSEGAGPRTVGRRSGLGRVPGRTAEEAHGPARYSGAGRGGGAAGTGPESVRSGLGGRQGVGAAGAGRGARGEDQRDRVRPVPGTQLAQDGLDVGLDGVLADEQVAADLPVRLALDELVQDVGLAAGQRDLRHERLGHRHGRRLDAADLRVDDDATGAGGQDRPPEQGRRRVDHEVAADAGGDG